MLNFRSEELKSKLFTISSGTRSKIEDHLLTGQLPKRVFIGLVLNEAFNGTLETNPFFFQHFNLSKMDVTCDGHSVYGKPFEPRFGNDQYLRSFLSWCRPLCRNLGSRVHFLVKVILIDFQLEKYMQCKEKYVYNFFLQY